MFENYLIALEVYKKVEKTQCDQLVHYIGYDGFKIYTTSKVEEDEKKIILLLKVEHFFGKENTVNERYKFFSY